jgi:hypothetical protein
MSEKALRKRLRKLEVEMTEQVKQGMEKGWPVFCWDKNCVQRELLRKILGMRRKPFCAADTMAGW